MSSAKKARHLSEKVIPVGDLKRDLYFDEKPNIDNCLLILGSRAGLHCNYIQSFQLIESFVNVCLLKDIRIVYRPHPDETNEYLDVLNTFKSISIVDNLKRLNFIPRYLVSPFSSLGYDLPFFAKKYFPSHFILVYHGFTDSFNDSYRLRFPDALPMLYSGAINYSQDGLSEFIAAIR